MLDKLSHANNYQKTLFNDPAIKETVKIYVKAFSQVALASIALVALAIFAFVARDKLTQYRAFRETQKDRKFVSIKEYDTIQNDRPTKVPLNYIQRLIRSIGLYSQTHLNVAGELAHRIYFKPLPTPDFTGEEVQTIHGLVKKRDVLRWYETNSFNFAPSLHSPKMGDYYPRGCELGSEKLPSGDTIKYRGFSGEFPQTHTFAIEIHTPPKTFQDCVMLGVSGKLIKNQSMIRVIHSEDNQCTVLVVKGERLSTSPLTSKDGELARLSFLFLSKILVDSQSIHCFNLQTEQPEVAALAKSYGFKEVGNYLRLGKNDAYPFAQQCGLTKKVVLDFLIKHPPPAHRS